MRGVGLRRNVIIFPRLRQPLWPHSQDIYV